MVGLWYNTDMSEYYSRLDHAIDKKEALKHFLVDLRLSKDRDILDKDHIARFLAALDIEMSKDDLDDFLYWAKEEYDSVKSELDRRDSIRREEARMAEIERVRPKVKPKGFFAQFDPIVLYVVVIFGLLFLVSFLKSIFT